MPKVAAKNSEGMELCGHEFVWDWRKKQFGFRMLSLLGVQRKVFGILKEAGTSTKLAKGGICHPRKGTGNSTKGLSRILSGFCFDDFEDIVPIEKQTQLCSGSI